jgi:hypothetical protein
MRTHSRRLWVAFGVVAVLGVLGLFVLDGPAAGVVSLVALLSFVGACIYGVAGEKVEDGAGGIGGPLGLG